MMKLPTNITFSRLSLVDDDYDDIYFQYSVSPSLQQSKLTKRSPATTLGNAICFRGKMDQSLNVMSNHELNYDDAETTVCNSSLDDESASDTSSFLTSSELSSFHEDTTTTRSTDEENKDDDMSSYLCQMQLSHSSSYYTALSSEQPPQDFDSSKALLPSLELVQRIDALLSKERSADYSITNYFEQQSRHDDNDDSHLELLESLSPSSTTTVEIICENEEDEYSPIDYECRVKMMEWSYRVLSYSFPYEHENNCDIHQSSRRRRKHSIQALHIVSQSFSMVDRYATTHYNNNHNKRSRRKVMDRNEYKLICMICLHIAAKTSGYFGLYNEREYDQSLYEDDPSSSSMASSDNVSSQAGSAHIYPPMHHRRHQEMTENEDDSCCYYLSSQESTFSSSLSIPSSISEDDDDNDCDTTGCNSHHQSNDATITDKTIVKSTPDTVSCSSNNSSDNDRLATTTHRRANITKSSSVTIGKQHKSHKRQRRPSLSILSLPGLVMLSAKEYTIEQLTSIELHVLQTLGWTGIGGSSSTNCTVLNWLWLLLDVIKEAAISREEEEEDDDFLIDNTCECSLINVESVLIEDTLNVQYERSTSCSLLAMASIIHALNEGYCCSKMKAAGNSYRKMLFDILPHEEEDVDRVIQLYFSDPKH